MICPSNIYKCEGPDCAYETIDKHQIHKHHIIAKSKGGSNKKFNIIRLCPNCHNRIYIPDCKRGIHSIKANNYIILKGIFASSTGLVLEYETENGSDFSKLDTWRNSIMDGYVDEKEH